MIRAATLKQRCCAVDEVKATPVSGIGSSDIVSFQKSSSCHGFRCSRFVGRSFQSDALYWIMCTWWYLTLKRLECLQSVLRFLLRPARKQQQAISVTLIHGVAVFGGL